MSSVQEMNTSENAIAREEPKQAERVEPCRTYLPAVDIVGNETETLLFYDMPGVAQPNVEISVENNVLTVKGSARIEDFAGRSLVYSEYGVGDYARSFTLSDDVDRENISASIKDGVLKVSIPKAKNVSKKISVSLG